MSFSLTKRLSLGVLCLGLLWGALSAPRQTAARSAAASVTPTPTPTPHASFSGQLTTQHDTWNRMTRINEFSGQQVFFEVTHIRVSNSGHYTIAVAANGFTPAINVYGGVFFPATPQANFWDNGVVGSSLTVSLAGAQAFDIVISTNQAGETGSYSVTITGVETGLGPIIVDPPPPLGILTNPLDTTITPGQAATLLVATQGRAPKTLQWFQGTSGDTSNPVAGATQASFTTPALFADTRYWVRVSNADSTVDSATATVFVTNGPISYNGALTPCDDRTQGLPFKPFRFRVTRAGNYSFRLDTNGFRGRINLYQGGFLPGSPNVNFFGGSALGTSVSLTQSLLVDGNVMHLIVLPESSATLGTFTVTVTSGPALATKLPAPEITTQPLSANVTRGQTPTLSVGTNSFDVSYQWFSGTCQSRTTIAGATAATFTPPPLTRDQSYFVRLETPGGYVYSSLAALTVVPFAGNLNANPVAKNQRLDVAAPGVLSNATGPDGRVLNAFKDTNPAHGTVTLNLNGSFSYQPALNYVGPDSFTFHVSDGVRSSNSATVNLTVLPTFANNTPNAIPTQGQASIYPSVITISGLTGNITKLIVTLNPLRHENEGDLDILLVGPQGQALVLMSDANGDPDNPFVFDRSITFDDAATDTIFDGRALFDGTYRPVNYGGGDSFPTPAPATFQSPAPAGTATLASVFNGTDPNGDWKLFVFDDQGFFSGSLGGWSLTIGTGAACPQFTVTPPTLPDVQINTPFPTTTLAASGGTGVYTFQLTAGTLPNGMNFTSAGVLSGTPTQAGLFPFTVTAKDQNNCTWQRAYTLNVNCPIISITALTLPTGALNQPYSGTLAGNGGSGPYSFSKLVGSLPDGVILNTNGTFSGTPTRPGVFTLTVQARDANGCTGTQDFGLTINCQAISVNTPANNAGLVNVPFSAQFTQTGGNGTTLFTTDSPLPDGIKLLGGGNLSGTATRTGTFPLVVTATDSNGCTGTANYTLTINACPTQFTVNSLSDTPDAAPGDTVCADANGQCTLRAALMEANAITACAPLTINFSVTGTINLAAALPALDHPNLTVNGPGAKLLTIARLSVPARFRHFFINSGRTANISGLTLTGGDDDNGGAVRNEGTLTLNNAVITGNTVFENGGAIRNGGTLLLSNSTLTNNSATGAFNEGGGLYNQGAATVVNTTIAGNSANSGGGVLTTPGSTLTLVNTTITGNTAATGSGGLSNTGGTAFVRNSISAANANNAALPDVAGAFTSLGNNLIGNKGTATGFNAAGDQTGTAANPLDPKLAPLGDYGGATPTCVPLPGSPALNAGSNCVLTNSCASNNLGFNLTADQRNVARPQNGTVDAGAVEAQTFTLALTGGNNQSATVAAQFAAPLQVNLKEGANNLPGALITFTGLANGAGLNPVTNTATTDTNGNVNLTVTANTLAGGPYNVSAATGALSQTFTLTNLPGAPAQLAFGQQPGNAQAAAPLAPAVTVRVLDAFGNPTSSNASIALTLGANPGGATLSGTTTVNAANGLATFSTLALNRIGNGYTLAAGSAGLTGAVSNPFNITCPGITLSSLPGGTAGVAYNQSVTAAPAGGAYSFAVTNGALPNGLTLNSNGSVSGVPTAAGTFNFTITATGFGGCSGAQSYSLVIACPTITLSPASPLPNAQLGVSYTQTLSAAPNAAYSFAVTNGTLPPGLTLTGNTLSGTPNTAGTFSFAITATAFGACTGTQGYSLTVTATCATITLNPASLPGGTLGTAYAQTLTATGGSGTYTFSVMSGVLPPGLTLDANTGVISGTPSAGGTFTPTIKAAANGCSGQRTYVIVIACAPITINPATLPSVMAGQSYNQQLTANVAGAYSLLIGSLPPGLSLNSSGLISGTTTQTGTYNLTVKLTAGICSGTRAYTLTVSSGAALRAVALAMQGDYDGDGKSDPALWSAQTGAWSIARSSDGQTLQQSFGAAGDVTLLGDYDGDGKSDLAVFRPANATFYVKRSSDGGFIVKQWGLSTDVPVPGDYDGDGITDLAVWRGATGTWYVLRSADGQAEVTAWGASVAPYNDVAVPGDYDGDGKTDVAVFRRGTGQWLIKLSSGRSSDGQYIVKAFGVGTDTPVAADYDGDGKTDIAVWRGGTWYIWESTKQTTRVVQWGTVGDQTAAGDYDGDGKTDVMVWRPATGPWFVKCSGDGAVMSLAVGRAGDQPVLGRH